MKKILSIVISIIFLTAAVYANDASISINDFMPEKDAANQSSAVKTEQPIVMDIQDFDGTETFDSNLGEFTSYTISGEHFIYNGTDGNPSGCAYYDDYYGDNNAYLVSNGLYTIPDEDNIAFNFDQKDIWPGYYILHEVLVTENFTGYPSTTAWTVLYESVAPSSWTTVSIDLAAYRGVAVTFAFHYTGDYADEWFIDNVSVSEAEPGPHPECDLEGVGPNDNWTFVTSDIELGPYVVYDNYICDHQIDMVKFYGLDLAYNDGWEECTEIPMDFEIVFYPDNGSTMPDIANPYISYIVQPERVNTGILYANAFELVEWTAVLDETCFQLEGWLSIQGYSNNFDNCVFLWLNSLEGDLISYQNGTLKTYDFARSLQEMDRHILHVSTTGNDTTGDGSENNPFATIQHGINTSSDGDTVLVAEGHYYERINFYGKSILLTSEFMWDDDTLHIQNTIIDADTLVLGVADTGSVVCFVSGEDSTSAISGFKLQKGFSRFGGGIYCFESSPTISNNTIIENYGDYGGGIWCFNNSSPSITNNSISGNSADYYGGGISCRTSSPMLSNNMINENSANSFGGGIYSSESSPTISNNTITENSTNYGAGIFCYDSSPDISNNTITGNLASDDGGGICCLSYSSPTIINNTITGNSSDSLGGGIYCNINSTPVVINTIFWANIADSSSNEIYLDNESSISITYSDIQGDTLWPGEGNINADPLFCLLDTAYYWIADNSPCAGAGCDSLGNPDSTVNIGAFGIGCSNSPSCFGLIFPVDSDTTWDTTTTLIWQQSESPIPDDSILYQVYYDTLADLSTTVIIDDIQDTTFALLSLLDDYRYYWTIKAEDTNTDGTWADDTLSFYTYLPEIPGLFGLIYPNVDDSLDLGIVLFEWNESLDPDPGDSITYLMFFSFEDSSISIMPESLWVDIGVVNAAIDIDYLLLDIVEGDTVNWWVTASSQYPDTSIESDERFAFILPDDTTGIYEYTHAIPADFFISQNHPNPFNPVTKIEYGLPEASDVQISIFDILGRQVEVLINNHQEPGYHHVIWNAGALPSGIYFYRIHAEKFNKTKKMLLLK